MEEQTIITQDQVLNTMNLENESNIIVEGNSTEFDIPSNVIQPVQSKPVDIYDYADLTMICSCGNTVTYDKGIPENNAVQLLLVGRSDSSIKFTCEKCNTTIELKMIESPEEDKIIYRERDKVNNTPVTDEPVQETSETNQVDLGVSTDNQPTTEVNV